MKQIILSIEQMKHLESLGLDTSDASMCYIINNHINPPSEGLMIYNKEFDYQIEGHTFIPAYTLQDILEKLPNKIQTDEGEMSLVIDHYQHHIWVNYRKMVNYEYELQYEGIYHGEHHFNYIEAFYNMLLWCIENNHIKTSNK